MSAYAVVIDGAVVNTVDWDGDIDSWQPPDGAIMLEIPEETAAGPGWSVEDGEFCSPDADAANPES